jgi:hypothetical protein
MAIFFAVLMVISGLFLMAAIIFGLLAGFMEGDQYALEKCAVVCGACSILMFVPIAFGVVALAILL